MASIANTIKDYRAGEIEPPSAEHVSRWVEQFDRAVRLPVLREVDYLLKQTYFSKAKIKKFFAHQIEHDKLAGDKPCEFWQKARILDIQQNGHSQTEIRALFGEALKKKCGLNVDECGARGGAYIYLDDALFSGSRIGNDLSAWIADGAPKKGIVHILVIAAHRFGEWKCSERLKEIAAENHKELEFHIWAAARLENRRKYRHKSEVLWPAALPEDAELLAYVKAEKKFPFEPRNSGGKLEHAVFSSEEGRQLIERELLLAGMRIRSFCDNPSPVMRPLGFSHFGLGFGATIVTFRNCPNNCPLALWWGDPNANPDHPFSKWYPLLPRKTYAQEVDFDVVL